VEQNAGMLIDEGSGEGRDSLKLVEFKKWIFGRDPSFPEPFAKKLFDNRFEESKCRLRGKTPIAKSGMRTGSIQRRADVFRHPVGWRAQGHAARITPPRTFG
jgi:hypothetical protein